MNAAIQVCELDTIGRGESQSNYSVAQAGRKLSDIWTLKPNMCTVPQTVL